MQTCFSCWLLTFSCCFWSGYPVVSDETWINPTRAAFFFFLSLHSRWSPFWLRETWRSVFKFNWLEKYHDLSIHEEKRNFLLQYLWCHRSLKKKKKRKNTVHSTNEDWSWKISPSLCWTFRNWFVLYFNFLSLIVTYSSQFTWQGHRKLQWAMSKDEPLLSNCPLETAEPSRNYARVPGYKKKYKKNTRKRREKKRKMNGVEIFFEIRNKMTENRGKGNSAKGKEEQRRGNQYARDRRYKITSTLGLLVRGDPQKEGLRGLQPRALGSKLDYFHAGITSTRLHRLPVFFWMKACSTLGISFEMFPCYLRHFFFL